MCPPLLATPTLLTPSSHSPYTFLTLSHWPHPSTDYTSFHWPHLLHPPQCHVSSIPVYTDMKRRTFKSFLAVIIPSVLICFCVYTLTGVFGLLRFPHTDGGACIASDILRNYCPGDIVVDVARGLLAVVIVTSYPILTFCGRYVCVRVCTCVRVCMCVCMCVWHVLWPTPSLNLDPATLSINYSVLVEL